MAGNFNYRRGVGSWSVVVAFARSSLSITPRSRVCSE